MQVINPFNFVIGGKYSINGQEVRAVTIRSHGPRLDFLREVYFEDTNGSRYKANVWKDGDVYRIVRDVPMPKLILA